MSAVITRAGFLPVMMETDPAHSRPTVESIRSTIASCRLMIIILGARFGSINRASRKYFLEIEYEEAIKNKLDIYSFFLDDDLLERENYKGTSIKDKQKLIRFKGMLKDNHTPKPWDSKKKLVSEVFLALSNHGSSIAKKSQTDTTKELIKMKVNKDLSTKTVSKIYSNDPISPIIGYEELVKWYNDNLINFESHRDILSKKINLIMVNLINKKIISEYIINSRTKKPASLKENLIRPRKGRDIKSISDVNDLIGIRVIVMHETEVELVASRLVQELKGSEIQTKAPVDILSFGYRSYHIIAPLTVPINGQLGFHYEIQIRTSLQHAWAQIEHKLGYKATVYDDKSRRLFAQVSALLEIADEKFTEIKNRQQLTTLHNNNHEQLPEYSQKSLPANPSFRTEIILLTPLAVFNYFHDDKWAKSTLLKILNENGFKFTIETQNDGDDTTRSWVEPLFLLGNFKITTINELNEFLKKNAILLKKIIVEIKNRIKFSDVSPLLLLWITTLFAYAESILHLPFPEIHQMLNQYRLFLKDDREEVALIISRNRN